MRDKYVEERFPFWKSDGPLVVSVMDGSGDGLSGEALVAEHNRTVDALIDTVKRLSPEQQAEWLAAWDRRPA
jgi:hypothetical protein